MNDELLADLLAAVEQQLVAPQTKYVAKTFDRLTKLGLEEAEAKEEITRVVSLWYASVSRSYISLM